jgi:hypothetical protein
MVAFAEKGENGSKGSSGGGAREMEICGSCTAARTISKHKKPNKIQNAEKRRPAPA